MENIRIALIDTGISEEYCKNKKINVKHYYINDNNLVERCNNKRWIFSRNKKSYR